LLTAQLALKRQMLVYTMNLNQNQRFMMERLISKIICMNDRMGAQIQDLNAMYHDINVNQSLSQAADKQPGCLWVRKFKCSFCKIIVPRSLLLLIICRCIRASTSFAASASMAATRST